MTLLLLFSGCENKDVEADYLFFDNEVVVLVDVNDTLLVLSIPREVVLSYGSYKKIEGTQAIFGLLGLKVGTVTYASAENLEEIRTLLAALAFEQGLDDDASGRILALYRQAKCLRKSGLPDTLAKLSGYPVSLEKLAHYKSCHHFDLGQILEIDDTTDWQSTEAYVRIWLEGALRLGNKEQMI
ncbi:MAG: hypothetical protein WCR02_05930 [Sphaerochaetaceae bacterium]